MTRVIETCDMDGCTALGATEIDGQTLCISHGLARKKQGQ